ncbi:hypothetical protein EZY14_011595 [Kordia sp. TARA_039_SRF]|nr:hypothetical protein EZY14_011595 [Kordia sp. TARA_039_SRF]
MELKEGYLPISSRSVVQGTIDCSSAAPAIATDARQALFIALTNPSKQNVEYAIYNDSVGKVVASGTLTSGNSTSVIVKAQDNPNIVRIQNQSPCDASGVTPQLTYAASTQ